MCDCMSCVALRAADRLVDAGYASSIEDAYALLRDVVPVADTLMSYKNQATLLRLDGVHGATLYRILWLRKHEPILG